jgi:membrane-associated protease RseP (regulator of RpoE activity)
MAIKGRLLTASRPFFALWRITTKASSGRQLSGPTSFQPHGLLYRDSDVPSVIQFGRTSSWPPVRGHDATWPGINQYWVVAQAHSRAIHASRSDLRGKSDQHPRAVIPFPLPIDSGLSACRCVLSDRTAIFKGRPPRHKRNIIAEGCRETFFRSVKPDGPAAIAGVQAGDEVIGINGETASDIDLFRARQLLTSGAGQTAKLKFVRGDQPLEASLTIRDRIAR